MLAGQVFTRLAAALAACVVLVHGAPAVEFSEAFRAEIQAGRPAAAAQLAQAEIAGAPAGAPADGTAHFALGVARFLGGVEALIRDFHRYGLYNGAEGSDLLGLAGLPFLRLPVPGNPAPEPVSYEALRATLAGFGDALAGAEAALAGAGTQPVDLPLDLDLVRLDLDGDGRASDTEGLLGIFEAVAVAVPEVSGKPFPVDFDSGDAAWLQAYTHLLMAMTDFVLAHDWEQAYTATFHGLFPDSFTPQTLLAEIARDAQAKMAEAMMNLPPEPEKPQCRHGEPLCDQRWDKFRAEWRVYSQNESYKTFITAQMALEFGAITDVIGFVHLNHWPVVESARMASALGHLESMVALSRESWRRILAETDDRREWLPAPSQTGVIPGMRVDTARLNGWAAFLDELEQVLKGEKLLPHWRFTQGFNLRRMFLEPRTFDIVLLAQGSAIAPYLEDGPIADQATWMAITDVFGGDFFSYFIWIN